MSLCSEKHTTLLTMYMYTIVQEPNDPTGETQVETEDGSRSDRIRGEVSF